MTYRIYNTEHLPNRKTVWDITDRAFNPVSPEAQYWLGWHPSEGYRAYLWDGDDTHDRPDLTEEFVSLLSEEQIAAAIAAAIERSR